MNLKICTNCKHDYPLNKFTKNTKTKDGLSLWCKSCFKQYRIDNKLKIATQRSDYDKQYGKQYRIDNKSSNVK